MIVRFPGGGSAVAVEVPKDACGDDVVAALGLPAPRATVVVNGTTAELDAEVAAQVSGVIGASGLAGALVRDGLTVVTGGTDAGIFAILGRGMGGRTAPLVGVVPRHLVAWPGGGDPDGVPLEPHHSHFVLVDGTAWGDETGVLLALTRALGRRAPSVAVICGGGPVTRREVAGHVCDARPLVVVAGSGRVADELAATAGGDISVCPLSAGAGALVDTVLAALGPV